MYIFAGPCKLISGRDNIGSPTKAFFTCQFRSRSRTPKIHNPLTINIIQNHPVLHLLKIIQMENKANGYKDQDEPETLKVRTKYA